MQQLPIPCPAHLIPDATGTDAFHAAREQVDELPRVPDNLKTGVDNVRVIPRG
ncbi:hypothetical protein ABZ865_29920 [Streptomyces sp. NPDC047085]|uniref:hypothetical protein n=1 Tax=Streptomyces sp. NPDC047085 TaxID=3155140 RepID=UPI0033C24BBD